MWQEISFNNKWQKSVPKIFDSFEKIPDIKNQCSPYPFHFICYKLISFCFHLFCSIFYIAVSEGCFYQPFWLKRCVSVLTVRITHSSTSAQNSKCCRTFTLYKPGVSNTPPVGRMWPTKGVYAARESLLNRQNYKFLSMKDGKCSNFVKLCTEYIRHIFQIAARRAFLTLKCGQRRLFHSKLGPSMDLSLRTLA
jgi:hypothetical protein